MEISQDIVFEAKDLLKGCGQMIDILSIDRPGVVMDICKELNLRIENLLFLFEVIEDPKFQETVDILRLKYDDE